MKLKDLKPEKFPIYIQFIEPDGPIYDMICYKIDDWAFGTLLSTSPSNETFDHGYTFMGLNANGREVLHWEYLEVEETEESLIKKANEGAEAIRKLRKLKVAQYKYFKDKEWHAFGENMGNVRYRLAPKTLFKPFDIVVGKTPHTVKLAERAYTIDIGCQSLPVSNTLEILSAFLEGFLKQSM